MGSFGLPALTACTIKLDTTRPSFAKAWFDAQGLASRYCAMSVKESVSLSAREPQTRIERQRDLAGKSNRRDIGARSKQNGTRTYYARSGLQQPGPALFKRLLLFGDCQLVGCLWRPRRHRVRHRPKSRGSCLGCRSGPESQWLPNLLRYCPWNVSSVLRCGQ